MSMFLVPTEEKEWSRNDNKTEGQKRTKSRLHTERKARGWQKEMAIKKQEIIIMISISCGSNAVTFWLAIWKENSSSSAWCPTHLLFLKAASKEAQQLVAFFPPNQNTPIWVSKPRFGVMAHHPEVEAHFSTNANSSNCSDTLAALQQRSNLQLQDFHRIQTQYAGKPEWNHWHLKASLNTSSSAVQRAKGTAGGLQLCRQRCSLHQEKQAKPRHAGHYSSSMEAQVINQSSLRCWILWRMQRLGTV